jgi:hypothetical protein
VSFADGNWEVMANSAATALVDLLHPYLSQRTPLISMQAYVDSKYPRPDAPAPEVLLTAKTPTLHA